MCVGGMGWWEVTYQVDTVHDADAEGHEGLGEVDDLFTLCCDSEARNCQVSFLKHRGRVESHHVKHTARGVLAVRT